MDNMNIVDMARDILYMDDEIKHLRYDNEYLRKQIKQLRNIIDSSDKHNTDMLATMLNKIIEPIDDNIKSNISERPKGASIS